MPLHNLILNGTFDAGAAHWTGNDIEASYNQSSYIAGGSNNRVAEIDGHRGQTTVMQQSFSVDSPITTQLTFDVALRTASNANAGIEGFEVEILDDAGNVVSSMSVLPTTNSFNQVSLDITFPAAGDYTLRFTELGPDDSLGAIVDNIEMMVCFCAGTLIATEHGQRPVEDLRPGDRIVTARGLRFLRWVGRRPLSRQHVAQNPKLRPVRIGRGALGDGMPHQPLYVSRQHRMLVRSRIAQRMFGEAEVFVAAARLLDHPDVSLCDGAGPVTYFHMLFDAHEVVYANGAPSESFLVTERSLSAVTPEARAEISYLFPDLAAMGRVLTPPARPIPRTGRQKRLIERALKNQHALLEPPSVTQIAV
ncbi:Hint domain-containing protein [Tritonibacter scottomollicae]|uniref:Hint domain-containing protein n=1 Tax=Tritonibacter scottomollicae TaxID=483013 RepID=UPI003AA85248